MAQTNIVFLIDVNAFPRGDPVPDPESAGAQGPAAIRVKLERDGLEGDLPFPAVPGNGFYAHPISEDFEWLKVMVLLTLYKEANIGEDYDLGRVQWAFKFFDSSRHVDYRDGRAFMPFDNDSFSNFENHVDQRLGKRGATAENNADSQQSEVDCGVGIKYLSDTIKIITGGLPWPESPSLDNSKSFNDTDGEQMHNNVVVFFRVPRTERELVEFSGLQPTSSSKDFMGLLLPSAFSRQFHFNLKIQLNFIDMWTAYNNFGILDTTWNRHYPRQITKCLSYLGGGRILPIPQLHLLEDSTRYFGLVPYQQYLRSLLQKGATQNENVPSHIKRLAPATSKPCQKISPDFDTSSLSRSLKSVPSLLENSMNSQCKMLRPFRPSSGFVEDEDPLEFHQMRMANIKAQDRLREGDRKRKRIEYEPEDYYDKPPHRSDRSRPGHHIEDMEYDSVDTDSQCEKEQRLESWINEGSFSKHKKHLDTTTSAVPMSRSFLNKSHHVFHEPAPKAAGSRAKKMLATVERQKFKVTVGETRRRSSEGVDLKRIAQQQEKELSAIKRRLKIHLEGELGNDDDVVAWTNNFRKQLRSFADVILEDDNPCLVALAQALVNNASVKFTLNRISKLRAAYKKRQLSAKELLEELLLVDFPSLNKKIISAHETRGKTSSTLTRELATRKLVAFRETELQIILRLEIAWCFVEPDEEATEKLLAEVVRLLQIISAYRTKPPIDDFINSVLLPTYRQSSRFLKEVYKRMNIPLPFQLAIDGSPLAGSSRHDDDASMISSTSSANLYPEDSASQLHLHKPKRFRQSPPTESRMRSFGHYTTHKRRDVRNSNSKKTKRQILVTTSNPKLPASTSQYIMERTNAKKAVGAKTSPKRVRRNLFDVKKHDKKDSKTLLTLSSSRLTKSPAFKSPKGKSPMSGSGFFRAARSRRQLVMSSETQQFGSPSLNSDVLCPESPATPGDRRSVCSKYAGTTTSGGSVERHLIVKESPELLKNDYDGRPMAKVASLSFYSITNKTSKSRAWEKSETQLLAARIKDSVDLRTREDQGLMLSDLELFPQSPDVRKQLNLSASPCTPKTNICYDSSGDTVEKPNSPPPSKTEAHSLQHFTGPAPDLDNPNIEALIKSNVPIHFSLSKDTASSLPQPEFQPHGSPSAAIPGPSNLQTPSKRVQFNLNENLVNTPASARRTSNNGTPKSILKEAQDT